MPRSAPVDGFSLAYDRHGAGAGAPVMLLHGWPGDRADWREVVARLRDDGPEIVVPDLRGFGESDTHDREPAQAYGAAPQARSVLGLLDELGLGPPGTPPERVATPPERVAAQPERVVVAGYDVGSRVAQQLARTAPDRVRALVVAPPLPGPGERVLAPGPQAEFWYQAFHRLGLPEEILDGRPDAVRAYLRHFWCHWSGPGFEPDAAELDRLAERYGAPGAFVASIGWYRAGSGTIATALSERAPAPQDRIAVATTVLWPEHDPLFPPAWADRIDEFFSDATVRLLPGVGHFTPLEAPDEFAAAIRAALAT